jgi:hypothetical protein
MSKQAYTENTLTIEMSLILEESDWTSELQAGTMTGSSVERGCPEFGMTIKERLVCI